MKDVMVVSVRPKGHPFPIVAWLIMLFQGMNPFGRKAFSHMAVVYKYEGLKMVVHSTGSKGVQIESHQDFIKRYRVVHRNMIHIDTDAEGWYNWLSEVDEKAYDHLSILGHTLAYFGIKKASKYGDGLSRLICCELVIEMLIIFRGLEVIDTDVFDLNKTRKMLNDFR